MTKCGCNYAKESLPLIIQHLQNIRDSFDEEVSLYPSGSNDEKEHIKRIKTMGYCINKLKKIQKSMEHEL